MRNWAPEVVVALVMLGTLAPMIGAQAPETARRRPVPPGYVTEGVPKMPDPPGPAPKHDLTGAWVGPQNLSRDPMPALTSAGEARFKTNKPETVVGLAATNDPFVSCDPLGFPRNLFAHAVSSRGGMWFEPVPNRMVILYEQQRVWRDVWMDGRQLPANVDARGAVDSRFYGYSVGHWDGDTTFVIDTTGLDPRTWLDENGHPHSKMAHIQERYTRVDQYNIHLEATLNDPTFYTAPWTFLKANYYWMKNQDMSENFCVPSEAIEYRDTLARPAGTGNEASK